MPSMQRCSACMLGSQFRVHGKSYRDSRMPRTVSASQHSGCDVTSFMSLLERGLAIAVCATAMRRQGQGQRSSPADQSTTMSQTAPLVDTSGAEIGRVSITEKT